MRVFRLIIMVVFMAATWGCEDSDVLRRHGGGARQTEPTREAERGLLPQGV
ncbi:MAG: hypothetical protein GY854_29585 [Deltaproteobacteria bacterium]|nr:hypothetical protein [Deltaproteobacteria bacterium]